MRRLKLSRAFTFLEPGPVVLVTTHDGRKNNIMTISWTLVVDFTPIFAITTGAWNFSYAALQKTRECVIAIPAVDLLDEVIGIGTCTGIDTDKFARFKRTFHAVGDGTFIVDGRRIDRRKMMAARLPTGI